MPFAILGQSFWHTQSLVQPSLHQGPPLLLPLLPLELPDEPELLPPLPELPPLDVLPLPEPPLLDVLPLEVLPLDDTMPLSLPLLDVDASAAPPSGEEASVPPQLHARATLATRTPATQSLARSTDRLKCPGPSNS